MKYLEPMLRDGALSEKVIFITGGGTGLGKAMATYFSELGAKIAICGRTDEVLKATAEEIINKTGGEVFTITCDVRDAARVKEVWEAVVAHFGRIDILVNNAAGNFISPTERLSSRAFDAVIDIVLKGSVYFTLEAGKYWIAERRPGSVLNIVTTYAWTGSGYVVPSACAKAGVLALTRSLAVEWAKYGIRSNAIAPGPFPTKGAWERLLPGPIADKFDAAMKVPLKRVGEFQELANLAAYLVSDYAAYVNGEVVTIDGGEWLKGAGEFNHLDELTADTWDEIEDFARKNRGK